MISTKPMVSIGIPIFNGSKTLDKLFNCLINQSYENIEFIISNNCSTDDTEKKCKHFLKKLKNVKYFSQKKMLTMHENFSFVLNQANNNAKYFTWMAADDYRSNDFLEANIEFLEKNFDYIASMSPAKFDIKKTNSKNIGDLSLEHEDFSQRLKISINRLHANSRFFSVFKKNIFKDFEYLDTEFLGYDYLYILHAIRKGKFKKISKGSIILSKEGSSNQKIIFKKNRNNYFEIFFPFHKLLLNSLYLYRNENFYIKYLLILNINSFNFFSILLRFKWLLIKFLRNESN